MRQSFCHLLVDCIQRMLAGEYAKLRLHLHGHKIDVEDAMIEY